MKNDLDQELERAVAATNDVEPTSNTLGAAPMNATQHRRSGAVGLSLLAVLVVVVGGVVAIVLFGFKSAAVYALPASELKARSAELAGRKVRVEGELVPGSLQKRDSPCEYKFTLQSKGTELDIVYPQCVVPDTFRDRPEGGVKVTVTGALAKDGHFEATEILAKCASKYDPKTHQMTLSDGTKVKQAPSDDVDDQ